MFKVDTATGNANGARLATQYWVKNNASGWGLTGNSGTTAGTNFIGTTDNVGLVFKVNSTLSGGVDIVNNNTSLGYSSLANNTSGYGKYNSALGYNALQANTTGSYNTSMGTFALANNTTGTYNTMIGSFAGYNVTGSFNTGIGYKVFDNIITTGTNNIAIGNQAGEFTSGSGNINIGAATFVGQSGNYNIGIGNYLNLVTGAATGTTIIGGYSGYPSGNITGNYNTLFGYNVASTNLSTGTNNIIIGASCDMPVSGGAYSNSLILSSGTGATVNGSNMGVITNGSSYNLKLGVNQPTPTAALHVTGTGTTSSTTTLRIENSSNNASLLIKDNGQISVNNTTPDASAIIDIETTTQGFLPPQMTTTQKNAISSPKEGLVVYDLTLHKLSYYNGSSWTNL